MRPPSRAPRADPSAGNATAAAVTAIVVVALGYVKGGTAPILDGDTGTDTVFVDPINAALAVTAIVIGFAVTAVTLAYAVRLYRLHGTLDVDAFRESRG